MNNPRRRRRRGLSAALVATAIGCAAFVAAPANAATAVFNLGGDTGAAAQSADAVPAGDSIHVDGSGWTTAGGGGSCIAVKLGNGSGAAGPAGALATKQVSEPASTGSCAGKSAADFNAWALIAAGDDGSFSVDIPFPTPSNSTPAISEPDWAAGTAHHLRMLTGAVVAGDKPRSAYLDFTVAPPTIQSVTAGAASIAGTATVGQTLTATTSGWTDGATFSYQWKRNGQDVAGATSASYALTAADQGTRISVVVTGAKEGYTSASVTSAETAPVASAGPAAQAPGTAAVTGKAQVGRTVRASTAGWMAGARLTYQWQRNGAAIAGATGAAYRLKAADHGKKIAVAVTGSLAGYQDAQATSPAVTVKAGALSARAPKVAGTAKVGKKLTAKRGTWTKGTKVRYRWYAGGKAIARATRSTFKITAKQKGKRITVKVTGTLKGYATVTKTSKATAQVT